MNIILFDETELSDTGRVALGDHRFTHLQQVLKVQPGDQVRVGVIGGDRGQGTIQVINSEYLELEVNLDAAPLPHHPTTLLLSLPRPKMLRRVLRSCAEFGVGSVHIMNSYRVEKSFWQSPLLHPQRLRQSLLTGLERSGNTLLPEVHFHKRFKPFVEDELAALTGAAGLFIAHPGSHPTFEAPNGTPHWVAVGPEGGFIPYEVESLNAQGGILRSLGQHILSVDTAVPTILGRALP